MTLEDFFMEHPSVALAFSGGVDSTYLLYAAKKYAKRVKAYYVKAEFQPEFEFEDAVRAVKELGVEFEIIKKSVLDDEDVVKNPKDRCYYCKKQVFGAIKSAAEKDGFSALLDGTNASDDADDRPGMKVLKETGTLSPLRICGITKKEVRRLSKEANLFTWDKCAYACLATRIRTGEKITAEKLSAVEKSEGYMRSLGFYDFRVRMRGDNALLQLREEQLPLFIKHRSDILNELKKYFNTVSLDLEVREGE